jgi:hypothetical protein
MKDEEEDSTLKLQIVKMQAQAWTDLIGVAPAFGCFQGLIR